MSKTLYIIRGLPGSGKSTLARKLTDVVREADQYFDLYFGSTFKPNLLPRAHEWCQEEVELFMCNRVKSLAVCNTFTQEWEMKPYLDLAEKYGYTVHTIIVENRHGNKSIHDVPESTIERMRSRFEIKL